MYKELTADDFRKDLGLTSDYKVDGVIVFGGSATERMRDLFIETLGELKLKVNFGSPIMPDGLFSNIKVIEVNGKRIWFDVVYGGAYLSELLHIACILGSRCNILIGMCGGLQKDIQTNDVVVPISSYGNESSTRAYSEADTFEYSSNKELSDLVISKIDYTRVVSGKLMTHQAMLAETKDDIERWSKQGYSGVEMESSTLFSVSNHFKVKSAAILQIADNLAYLQTVLSDEYKNLKEKRYEVRKNNMKVAIECLLKNI